jgi:hypothetical protein
MSVRSVIESCVYGVAWHKHMETWRMRVAPGTRYRRIKPSSGLARGLYAGRFTKPVKSHV